MYATTSAAVLHPMGRSAQGIALAHPAIARNPNARPKVAMEGPARYELHPNPDRVND